MTVDYPDYMNPATAMGHAFADISGEIAAFIATGLATGQPGGVPLLTYANQLFSDSAKTIGAGGLTYPATGVQPISQIGFDGNLNFVTAAAGLTAARIQMNWYDNGNYIAQDTCYFYAGTSNNDIRFQGPTKGNGVTFSLFLQGANTITLNSFQFYENSRVYPHDRYYTDGFGGVYPGIASTATGDLNSYLLAGIDQNIAAATTVTFAMPLWYGKCYLAAQTASGAADLQVTLQNTGYQGGLLTNPARLVSSASGLIEQTDIFLPKQQCTLQVRNGNAAIQSCVVALIAADY